MKQQSSKIKKKTFTNLISKIIFPFSQSGEQSINKYEGTYDLQESQTLKDSNNMSEISKIKRTKNQKPSFNELTKLISQFEKCDKKQFLNQMNPFTTLYAKNSLHSKYQLQSQKKYRSLTKSRSLTVNNRYTTTSAINQNDSQEEQTNPFASNKMLKYKQRSLTKVQSNWMKDREKEKEKQIIKVHQFDQQKIHRNYDHLGKLKKKTTYNQQEIKSRFVSFKDLPKQISQIDKQTFQNARKDFNKKFKTYVGPIQQPIPNQSVQRSQGLQFNQQQVKGISQKVAKKNFLKINPLYNMYRKDSNKGSRKKGDKKNYRISADQNLLKAKFQLGSQEFVENDGDKDQFYSEADQFGLMNGNEEGNNNRLTEKQANELNFYVSSSQELTNLRHKESQNQSTSIYDKVYFFSVKFLPGFASLFTIENVNLKSRSDGNFLIEVGFVVLSQVVISAYEEILVHRIKYNKHKWFQTMNHLKPKIDDKNHEKDKLKSALFAELMASREQKKNRQFLPVSVQLTSQKSNLQQRSPDHRFPHSDFRNFSRNSIDHQIDKNNLLQHQYLPYEPLSFMNFTKISSLSYQLIIEYLEKFCQLQVSYLGSSLKQADSQLILQKNTNFIKKKHSNIEQTFLESMKLARIFYFLVKINATYYVAKSVIIDGKKIKHYLLYEFSNMIRHEGGCVIEEEGGIEGNLTSMKDNELVKWLFVKLNRFFTLTALKKWKQRKSIKINRCLLNNQYDYYFNSEQHPLTNGLEVFFDVMSKVGLKHEPQIGSESMFKIAQGNFRNDVKWRKVSYEVNVSNNDKYKPKFEPFFIHHSAFDYGIFAPKRRDSLLSNPNSPNKHSSFLFTSPLITNSQQPKKFSTSFSYTISRNFEISIVLYPSVMRSAHQIVNLHVRKVKEQQIQNQFIKEQFALMHLEKSFVNDKRSEIQEAFLKEQYVKRIIRNSRGNNKAQNNIQQQHLFTIIKSKKYQIHVSLTSNPSFKSHQHNLMQQTLKIQAECRSTIKHYSLELKLGDIFSQLKQYYRLYTDTMSYSKFNQMLKRIHGRKYEVSKSMIVEKVKFYVQKLLLIKKNTYSQFYFVPLNNMVSEASVKASSIIQAQKQTKNEQKSVLNHSLLLNSARKQLIFQTLQQLQALTKQKQKMSLSSLSKITIKNFPIYEIYYKTVKKLLPGYFVIISIYYMPMFDLSQVKVYLNRIRKSFWTSVDRGIGPNEYEKIVEDVVEFVKEKFFSKLMKKETEKLSSKYRDFSSKTVKQAETSFLSKSRRTKEIFSGSSNLNSNLSNLTRFKRQHQPTQQNIINVNHFSQFTEQLLCKLFHSQRRNKYIIRLSYPATCTYVNPDQRKGIDEMINISVLKQNCMLIYKFQTTARKLLSKKLTHKFNVIQLEYQQKNKSFYILFEEIKTLIKYSDETTYGLLNTFRGYFLNKDTNNLVNNSFVSMLSLNILADVTSRNLQEFQGRRQNLYYDSPNNHHSFSTKTKFLRDLDVNKYQRYCLFMQNSKILEVLKIRKKIQKKSLTKSDRNIPSENNQSYRSRQIVRRKDRRQSIEAFLTEKNNILQTSIKSSQKNTKLSIKNFNKKPPNPDFIVQEQYRINEPFTQQVKSEENFEEKIVYFIDAQTEAINEVQSSIQDQGFMINVPFRKYNRKMFKRFFKHLILVREERQAHENQIKQAMNDIHLTSVLQIPEVNRGSFRSSHISSLQTFQ